MARVLINVVLFVVVFVFGCSGGSPAAKMEMSKSTTSSAPMLLTDSQLLEIAVLARRDGRRVSIVLSRGEVLRALGNKNVPNNWFQIEVDEGKLTPVWFGDTSGKPKDIKLMDVTLAGRIVRGPYSLKELGVTTPQQLLERFFEKQSSAPSAWWAKKNTRESKNLWEPDLVATLKAVDFEVARADVVPLLLARPKPTIQ